ncbi:hypothetical protein PENTCL1PPCAC_13755, partial [Pristionchus entomophagus]
IFFLCKLGKRVSYRVLLVFSHVMVILGYIVTFPFPFWSEPLQPYNETTRTGCNPLEYSWCDTQLTVDLVPYVIGMGGFRFGWSQLHPLHQWVDLHSGHNNMARGLEMASALQLNYHCYVS